MAIQQRQDHRVDADGLARPRGAGHQQMRHFRQIDDDRPAGDILAKRHRQITGITLPGGMVENFTEHHHLPVDIRQFNANHILTRHHRNPHRNRAHRTGDIVSQRNHTLRFCPRGRHQVMACHHRTIA